MINPYFTNVKILKIKNHCATFKRSKDSLFREGSILSHKKRHVKNLKRALSANFLNELFLIASKKEPSQYMRWLLLLLEMGR